MNMTKTIGQIEIINRGNATDIWKELPWLEDYIDDNIEPSNNDDEEIESTELWKLLGAVVDFLEDKMDKITYDFKEAIEDCGGTHYMEDIEDVLDYSWYYKDINDVKQWFIFKKNGEWL